MCWYCVWGWPKPVREIYDAAVAELGGDSSPLEFGPAHVVWADCNFGDGHVRSCLGPGAVTAADRERFGGADLAVVRRSLERLLEVPEGVRCPMPDDYDGGRAEDYPPAAGVEMVK